MLIRRELFFLPVLVAAVFGQGRQNLLMVEQPTTTAKPTTEGSIPLNFLMMQTEGNAALTFGFQLLKDLRNIRLDCDIRKRQEELQFTKDMDDAMQYIRETEAFLSKYPEENRIEVEESFRKTLEDISTERAERLKQIDLECMRRINILLESRNLEAISYVEFLLQKDPAMFAQLLFDVTAYSRQLQRGLMDCEVYYENINAEDPHGLCYGVEIDIVVIFIREFVVEADKLSRNYFQVSGDFSSGFPDEEYGSVNYGGTDMPGLIDDEDYVYNPSGGFVEEKPTGTEQPIRLTTPTMKTTEPPIRLTTPTIETTTEPPISSTTQPPTASTDNPTRPTFKATTAAPTTATGSVRPISHPTQLTHTKPPTRDPPTWIEEAFSEVFQLGQHQAASSPSEETPPTTETPTTEKTPEAVRATLEVELPGGEVEVDVEIGTDGVEVDAEVEVDQDKPSEDPTEPTQQSTGTDGSTSEMPTSDTTPSDQTPSDSTPITQDHSSDPTTGVIFIDPEDPDDNTGSGSEEHHVAEEEDSSSYSTYLVAYFLISIGGVLVIGIIFVSIAIFIVRQKQHSALKLAVVSEEEKISVMKQTGYVNPTYKFFDQVNDS